MNTYYVENISHHGLTKNHSIIYPITCTLASSASTTYYIFPYNSSVSSLQFGFRLSGNTYPITDCVKNYDKKICAVRYVHAPGKVEIRTKLNDFLVKIIGFGYIMFKILVWHDFNSLSLSYDVN